MRAPRTIASPATPVLFVAPLVAPPTAALLPAVPPLAEDREEAEARHALDRLRSEGGVCKHDAHGSRPVRVVSRRGHGGKP